MNPNPQPTLRPAVFLDRDGTIMEDVPYLSDPARVRLLAGACGALRRLHEAGYACVLVTNQSGIGRGLFAEEKLAPIHAELARRLAAEGVALDGVYYCPEAPAGDDPMVLDHPDRKPGPGMLIRAARELRLDLAASWMVGDKASDVLAGVNAGCLGSILVRTGQGARDERAYPDLAGLRADDLAAAADLILSSLHPAGRAEVGAPHAPARAVGRSVPEPDLPQVENQEGHRSHKRANNQE